MLIGSKCKKCRQAGQKLFLKGERCFSQKCAMIKRSYRPGVHGKSNRRVSEYGRQLAEKQKVRHAYGISEEQFKKYFREVFKARGNKEEILIQKLETRLDNVVFRLGWANSRSLSRQIVSHGHVSVNGRKLDIRSYQVKKGDIIKIKDKSKKSPLFKELKTTLKKHQSPTWLEVDKDKLGAKIKDYPGVDNFDKVGELSMIIEFYSR